VDAIHFLNNGAPLPNRARLGQMLAKAAAETDAAMFHTADLLRGIDQAVALNDANHYSKAFTPRVGEALLAAMEQRLRVAVPR
ncbi:MAG: hypothetical protein U1D35_05220, partial [Paracoccaceae bacterium]|nr:hypothetical protein [Paracoccaceae bacterium]